MKNRMTLVALLVIPMGAAFAWHEGRSDIPGEAMSQTQGALGTQAVNYGSGEGRLGTQAVNYGPGEGRLGTQKVNIGQSSSEPMLGTQSYSR